MFHMLHLGEVVVTVVRAVLGSSRYIEYTHKKDWLVGQVGFEPTTLRLKGECSAIELLTQPMTIIT